MSWISLSILVPAAAAALMVLLPRSRRRALAIVSAFATLSAALAAAAPVHFGAGGAVLESGPRTPWGGPMFGLDTLSGTLLPFFALLVVVVVCVSPRQDGDGRHFAAIFATEAAVLAIYASRDLVTLTAAWMIAAAPAFLAMRRADRERPAKERVAVTTAISLFGSGLLLAGASAALIAGASHAGVALPAALTSLASAPLEPRPAIFAVLMVAALLRKGVFPFHSWLPALFERGPLGLVILLFNGHVGAYLVARVAIPLFVSPARESATLVTALALISCLYAALLAVAQRQPRRALAFVAMSQASFVLIGLVTLEDEGVAGALVMWLSLGFASTAAVMTYRLLEVRVGQRSLATFHGYAVRTPRLAASFVLFGLAMAGLPGTLGFVAEDLLIHGVLDAHPAIGVLLVVAAGLNAINVVRMYAKLFLGRDGRFVPAVPDLGRREAWVLGLAVLALVANGLLPGPLVRLREQATADLLAKAASHGYR